MKKLRRSSVETIAACVLPASTYNLHVAHFYDSVLRRKTWTCHECRSMNLSAHKVEVSESESMIQFSDHVLHVAMQSDSRIAMVAWNG